ncbi:hypothetical protein EC991_007697 [Linnemannia zychae]|nr:hypothetical protein EC991_007697 [Linnemannia zychae]
MQQPDTTSDNVQAFRSVHKSQKLSTIAVVDPDDIIYIDCHTDPDNSQKCFILWEDIQQAFESALFVRDSKAKMLPFVKGMDYRPLEPRRIAAVPGVVLDVVVGGESTALEVSSLQKTIQDLSISKPPQHIPSKTPRNPAFGLVEEAMQNYNHIERPATLPCTLRAPQAIVELDKHEGASRNNDATKNKPASWTASTQRRDDLQNRDAAPFEDLMQTMISASQGNADAQFTLGNRYRDGREVYRDRRAAMDWFLKAAEHDHEKAQFMIGVLYFQEKTFEQLLYLYRDDDESTHSDKGIPQDDMKALEWFLKAANQGLADAQFGVVAVTIAIHKNPDPETISTILDWCGKAANQNHGAAQTYMGFFNMRGFGILKDGYRASVWFLKAIGRAAGLAEFGLGCLYEEGNGFPKDETIAFEWHLKSAEQGYRDGQLKVATRYDEGKGVLVNQEKAIEWYTKASKTGSFRAKTALKRLAVI